MGLLTHLAKVFSGWSDFNSRSSRSEYWLGFAFCLILTLALQAGLFALVIVRFGEVAVQSGEITAENQVVMWILCTSIFLFCIFMLPLTARRFKDHGWRGGWFRIASVLNFALGLLLLVGWAFTFSGGTETAMSLSFAAFFLAFPPYASVLWCFWIGFVKPDPNANKYGPNPHEVSA